MQRTEQLDAVRVAAEDAKDLRDFRERLGLPAEWLLVRSADGAATRAFLDELDFHFMKAGGGFDHPNQTFVFSPMVAVVGLDCSLSALSAGSRSMNVGDVDPRRPAPAAATLLDPNGPGCRQLLQER
jgi:hypothetical protein